MKGIKSTKNEWFVCQQADYHKSERKYELRTVRIFVMFSYFVWILLPLSPALAQQSKIDSLLSLLKTAKHDTTRISALNALGWELMYSNPDTAIILGKQALALANSLPFGKGRGWAANSLGNLGVYYYLKSDYPKALDYHLKALSINEEMLREARSPSEKQAAQQGIARKLVNIGIVYYEQADYPKALDYYLKALKTFEELGNKRGIATAISNIGTVYHDLAKDKVYPGERDSLFNRALDYFFNALKMHEKRGNKMGIAINLGNIGIVYKEQADYPKALDYYFKALKMNEELGNKNGIAATLGDIGSLYTTTGKFAEAEKYLKKAIAIDDSIGALNYLRQYEESLSELYDTTAQLATGNMQYAKAAEKYKLSLLHYKKAMVLKDTIFSEENKKQLIRKEMTYQFEKKELAAQAEQDKKDAVAAEESKRQRLFLWLIVAVAVAVAVIAAIILRSLRVTRKQKHVIELQKDEVTRQRDIVEEQKAVVEKQKEELAVKNKDITDSIRYAKEIQQAILPPVEEIKKALPESFVLFKPKDIVSGDFYFFAKVNKDMIIAACDSTGHGVPGAFMSMIGSQLLNEIVNDKSVNDAAEVLHQLRDGIIHAFGEAGATGRQKDGMDMALCAFQYKKDGSGVLLQYAGANNPLYIVRNNNKAELTVINADKQAVGYNFGTDSPFTNHNVVLQKGDTFYIFSDGYQDQFGGPDVKKFMKRRFRQLFLDICEKSMEEQKELMDKTIEEWKGNGVQVDDILVIGVRV